MHELARVTQACHIARLLRPQDSEVFEASICIREVAARIVSAKTCRTANNRNLRHDLGNICSVVLGAENVAVAYVGAENCGKETEARSVCHNLKSVTRARNKAIN